jgi:hypothetical protein
MRAADYIEPSFDLDALRCPRCGESNLHHVHVIVYERKEDDPKVLRTIISHGGGIRVDYEVDHENPSSRRHGLSILFECEHCVGGRGGHA